MKKLVPSSSFMKFEDSKGKAMHTFLLLRLCTPMVESKQYHTSTSRKGHLLLKISGMGYMKYDPEEQCPIMQTGKLLHAGMSRERFDEDGVRLNIPEFRW